MKTLAGIKVIGVMTYPSTFDNGKFKKEKYNSIPGSYVEWIKESGSEVIAINYDEHNNKTLKKMNKINGILFTGGPSIIYEINKNDLYDYDKISEYTKKLKFIIKNAIKINNKKNKKFSLFGICLGLQSLIAYFSKYKLKFDIVDNNNKSENINLTDNFSYLGELFKKKRKKTF